MKNMSLIMASQHICRIQFYACAIVPVITLIDILGGANDIIGGPWITSLLQFQYI